MASLFQKSGDSPSGRAKLFVWGESGTMKTTSGLTMPSPVVIDYIERGSELYRDSFDFGYLQTSSLDEVKAAIKELATGEHEYKTLILDPFTLLMESISDKWLNYFRRIKDDPTYELQGFDYRGIKREARSFIRSIQSLDMNVMITSRSKTKFVQQWDPKKKKNVMVEDGLMEDAIRGILYEVDLAMQFTTVEPGVTEWLIQKFRGARFAKLPTRHRFKFGEFYDTLSSFIGRKEDMEAGATSTLDKNPIRDIVEKLEKLGLGALTDQYSSYVAKKYELDSAESMDAEEKKEQHKIIDSLFDDESRLGKFKEMLETQIN
jgi:hypothetical protein